MTPAETAALAVTIVGGVGVLITALSPIIVALVNRHRGPVTPDLTDDLARVTRERDAFRAALRRANDTLAAHKLPLQHPDL